MKRIGRGRVSDAVETLIKYPLIIRSLNTRQIEVAYRTIRQKDEEGAEYFKNLVLTTLEWTLDVFASTDMEIGEDEAQTFRGSVESVSEEHKIMLMEIESLDDPSRKIDLRGKYDSHLENLLGPHDKDDTGLDLDDTDFDDTSLDEEIRDI